MAKFRDDVENHPVSWVEVHRDTRKLVHRLVKLGPWKGIVALTRGGLVPAAIVAREMGIRVIDTLCISSYDEQVREEVQILKAPETAVADQGAGWLLIDDLVDTGATAKAARKVLPKAHFAAVYGKQPGVHFVDTFVTEFPGNVWIFFPWDTEIQYAPPISDGG